MSEFDSIINDKIKYFFKDIESRIEIIENKVNKLENLVFTLTNKKEDSNINIVNLKKENMNIPNEIIKKSLIYKDYRTIILLFKYYYKNKSNQESQYPIKIKSKRMYEYYNNQWLNDTNAHYIKNTLFMNIQTELFKYNNLDNVSDFDDIYNNQVFINKLSDDKCKRDLFKHIVDEIQN